MLNEYKSGYINVTNGSAIVQGVGTSWLTYAQSGKFIEIAGVSYEIAQINSINELEIIAPYPEASASDLPYKIVFDVAQALNPFVPVFDFNLAKITKLKEINAAYVLANQTSFTYNGKAYSATDNAKFSLMAINGYVAVNGALPANYPNVWVALDGSVLSVMTVDDFKPIYAAMVAQGSDNFIKLAMLEAQINALPITATQQDFDAIGW